MLWCLPSYSFTNLFIYLSIYCFCIHPPLFHSLSHSAPHDHTPLSLQQSGIYDSGYGTLKRKAPPSSNNAGGKENSPSKKARKALLHSWSTPGEIQVPGFRSEPLALMPETPVSWMSMKTLSATIM